MGSPIPEEGCRRPPPPVSGWPFVIPSVGTGDLLFFVKVIKKTILTRRILGTFVAWILEGV